MMTRTLLLTKVVACKVDSPGETVPYVLKRGRAPHTRALSWTTERTGLVAQIAPEGVHPSSEATTRGRWSRARRCQTCESPPQVTSFAQGGSEGRHTPQDKHAHTLSVPNPFLSPTWGDSELAREPFGPCGSCLEYQSEHKDPFARQCATSPNNRHLIGAQWDLEERRSVMQGGSLCSRIRCVCCGASATHPPTNTTLLVLSPAEPGPIGGSTKSELLHCPVGDNTSRVPLNGIERLSRWLRLGVRMTGGSREAVSGQRNGGTRGNECDGPKGPNASPGVGAMVPTTSLPSSLNPLDIHALSAEV